MLHVRSSWWVYVVALCLRCVTTNGESCENKTLAAPLGSSVMLPCLFTQAADNWTLWVQTPGADLINLTRTGQVRFLDPRSGRVKAFPMQSAEGNFSIRIDELQNSDLGSYRCQQNHLCVELVLQAEPPGEEMLMVVIGVFLAALILLAAGGCCWIFRRRPKDYVDMNAIVAPCPAPEEPVREPVDHQLQGRYNIIVYENDDQNPAHFYNNSSCRNSFTPPDQNYLGAVRPEPDVGGDHSNANHFQRSESHRTKQKFHRELFNRLRQASLKRHYYVNQVELRSQPAAPAQAEADRHRGQRRKNKQTTSCEYPNPIYNRSTDHLNKL